MRDNNPEIIIPPNKHASNFCLQQRKSQVTNQHQLHIKNNSTKEDSDLSIKTVIEKLKIEITNSN